MMLHREDIGDEIIEDADYGLLLRVLVVENAVARNERLERREFKKLAENKLDSGFMASPAIAGHSLLLRSRTDLYRIED